MSYLIVGGSHQQQEQRINKICQALGINFSPNEPDNLIVQPQKSIGIEQVRQVKSFLNKKSWQGGAKKIVVIWQAGLLTIEAQNAFLKTLEEPPPNSLIFLAAANQAAFLPTILSRCHLIILTTETNKKELAEMSFADWQQLAQSPLSERLKKTELLGKNRGKLQLWLKEAILLLQNQLNKSGANFQKLNHWLTILSQAHQILNQNVNSQRVIDWVMIKL